MRELKNVFRVLATVSHAASWLVGTTWLGGKTAWKVIVLCFRWREIAAEVRHCPRGHAVPVYGLWDCACGARLEGWAFAPCEVCHETAAYVPCGVCGLPVRNPLLV